MNAVLQRISRFANWSREKFGLVDLDREDGEDIHALYLAQDRFEVRVRALLDFLDTELVLPG